MPVKLSCFLPLSVHHREKQEQQSGDQRRAVQWQTGVERSCVSQQVLGIKQKIGFEFAWGTFRDFTARHRFSPWESWGAEQNMKYLPSPWEICIKEHQISSFGNDLEAYWNLELSQLQLHLGNSAGMHPALSTGFQQHNYVLVTPMEELGSQTASSFATI